VPKPPSKNAFLDTLKYPTDGDYAEYPYPAYDTGIEVAAMNYTGNPWDEDGKSDDPFEVRGNLLIRPSPFSGFQCFVETGNDSWDVDPKTVRPVLNPEPKPRKTGGKVARTAPRKAGGARAPTASGTTQKPKAGAGKAPRARKKRASGAKAPTPSRRKAGNPKAAGTRKRKAAGQEAV
jgi:hypothetical protein